MVGSPSLELKYLTMVVVTDSDKHSGLLRYNKNIAVKSFIAHAPG